MGSNQGKKKMFGIIGALLLVLLLGATYAFFNYSRDGSTSTIITGNLYLTLNNGNDTISLTNIYPETKEEARARSDNTITFTVEGINETTDKDIHYEILLNNGDTYEEENFSRFNPKDLVFDLKEIDEHGNEELILDAVSFDDFNDHKIWIDKIDSNTTQEVTKTYELRMWLSEDVLISDTDPNADYDATGDEAFSNHYASVKIAVDGNLVEKDLPIVVDSRDNYIEDDKTYFITTLSNANCLDENGEAITLTITSSNNNVEFIYKDTNNQNVVASSYTGTYTLDGDDSQNIKIILSSVNGKADTTDLSFTATKGGQVIQELVKHMDVRGIVKPAVIITLGNQTKTYDGSAITIENPTITIEGGGTYSGTPTITYYSEPSCKGKALEGAPTNAGSYSVMIHVDETATYDEGKVCTAVTVNPKEILIANLVYSGTSKDYNASTAVSDIFEVNIGNNAGVISGDTVGVTYGTAAYNDANAGNSKNILVSGLTLTGADANNYILSSASGTTNGVINPLVVQVMSNPSDKTYTGSAQTIGVTVPNHAELVTSGSTTSATNAGTYTATYKLENTNYKWSDDTTANKEITWKIEKSNTTTTLQDQVINYTGTAQSASGATSKLSSTNSNLTGGTYTYSYYATEANCQRNNSALENIPTAAGTYYVKATLAGTSNYNASSSSCVTYSITTNTATCPTATDYSGNYDGNSHTITVGNNATGGTVEYRTATSGEGSTWTTSLPTRTNAGETTVYIRVLGDGNHETVNCGSRTITINAVTLTAPTTPSDKNYTGDTQTSGITCPTGSTASGVQTASDAGTYTQTCTLNSTTNYKWSDNTTAPKEITWEINKKDITITAKNQSVTYGTAISTATSQVTVSGMITGQTLDSITLTQSKTAVSTDGKITPSAAVIKSGSTTVTNNYNITYVQGNLTITPKTVTPAVASCTDKTYDGTTAATCTYNAVSGKVGSDVVSVTGGTCTFANANVGTDKAVTCSGVSLTGAAASNYALSTTNVSSTADITQKALTITAKPQSVTYGTAITQGTNQVTVSGLATGDALDSVTLTQSKTSVSTDGKITPSDAVIKNGSTTVTSNYNISYVQGNLTITAKSVTPTIASCTDKTYDGTNSATCTYSAVSGKVGSDVVNVTGGTCTFNNKNVGTDKAVTCTGLSLTGAAASNYTLSSASAASTADITAKTLTITATDKSMTYGGSAPTYGYTASGFVTGETNSIITGTASYTVKSGNTTVSNVSIANAGSYEIHVSGLSAANYSITYVPGTLTINKKAATCTITTTPTLTYPGSATGDVVYSCTGDGARSATSSDTTVVTVGTITNTTVPLTAKKIGSGVTITVSQAEGTNYLAATSATTNLDVVGTIYTVTLDNQQATTAGTATVYYQYNTSKEINNVTCYYFTNNTLTTCLTGGNTIVSPTKTGYNFGGYYTGENGSGTNYVNASGVFVNDLYKTSGNKTLYAKWTAGTLTFNNQTLNSGTYGTAYTSNAFTAATSGTGSYTYAIASGAPTGATINSSARTISFPATTPAGTYNVVVSVTDEGNGATTTATMTIVIAPKALTITAKAQTVQYGTAISTGTGQVTISGLVNSDTLDSITLTQSKTAVSTDGKITPSGAVIKNGSTTVTSNYNISYVQGNLTVSKKDVTATIGTCSDKTYDGTNTATCTINVAGKVGSETVTASGTCTFANANAGTDKAITCNSLSLGGTNASNYNLTTTSLSGSADITQKALTITATAKAQSVTYGTAITQGTNQVTVSGLIDGDALDSITLTQSKTAVSTDGKITPSAAVIKKGSTTVTSNYNISYVQGNLTITKKDVTASIGSCSDKTYDGTNTATCTINVVGKVGSETVTASGTCTFANADAGTDKAITCNNLSLGGTNASNYNLTTTIR